MPFPFVVALIPMPPRLPVDAISVTENMAAPLGRLCVTMLPLAFPFSEDAPALPPPSPMRSPFAVQARPRVSGGYLFAIAVDLPDKAGFGVFLYRLAEDVKLERHCNETLGATHLGQLHPFHLIIELLFDYQQVCHYSNHTFQGS